MTTINQDICNKIIPLDGNMEAQFLPAKTVAELILKGIKSKGLVSATDVATELKTWMSQHSVDLEKEAIFNQACQIILCQIEEIPDENLRVYVSSSVQKYLADIKKELEEVSIQSPNISQTYSRNEGVETGDLFNQITLDYWKELTNLRLDSGVFASGFNNSAATIYGRALRRLFDYSSPLFNFNTDLAIAAFNTFPQSTTDFDGRNITGIIPSATVFGGTHYNILPFLDVRGGVQSKPTLLWGRNYGLNYVWDNSAGAAFGIRTGSTNISGGAILNINVGPYNIQGGDGIGPRYENLEQFVAVQNPVLNADARVALYRTGKELSSRVWKNFDLFGGTVTGAVHGFVTLEGNVAASPPSVFFSLAYSAKTADEGVAAFVRISSTATNIRNQRRFGDDGAQGRAQFAYNYNAATEALSFLSPEVAIYCSPPSGSREGSPPLSSCIFSRPKNGMDPLIERHYCEVADSGNGNSAVCMGASSSSAVSARIYAERSSLDEPFRITNYELNFNDAYLQAMWQHETIADFARQVDGVSYDEKLLYLEFMTRQLYQTYDRAGLAIANGSGSVNTIDYQETYATLKHQTFNTQEETTTVCRGIARFIAHVANEWGFKSYVATVQTKGMGHVVALVQPPGGNWTVIGYGKNRFTNSDQSLVNTLDNFSMASGYPPQLFYEIYDHEGRYVRRVETNLGSTLFQKTTTPDRLESFLLKTGERN